VPAGDCGDAAGRHRRSEGLAVSTAQRLCSVARHPTLKEAGIDVEADAWMGLIAPAGLSARRSSARRAGGEAITSAAIRDKLTAQLMEPIPGTPAEFRARIEATSRAGRRSLTPRRSRSTSSPARPQSHPSRTAEAKVQPALTSWDVEMAFDVTVRATAS